MNSSLPPSPTNVADAPTRWFDLAVLCLCFVLSGVAALIYQTVWARQFALVFGTSELAIAAVLAAYMGGLALGAALIEKRMHRVRRPVLWYAAIEAGIAVAALLLVPAGLRLADHVLTGLFGGQAAPPDATLSTTSLFYLMASFAVLLIPTTLMGATLPLLTRYAVHSEQQIGARIGMLYTCNTLGAVGGALLGALVLMPKLGMSRTVWVAALINVVVAALVFLLNRGPADAGKNEPHTTPAVDSVLAPAHAPEHATERYSWSACSPVWVLPLMAISGAVSFLHEVLWTRMLSHVLGSSLYAFGVMLASFLAGIALGGGAGALLAKRREGAARWLAIGELGAAVAAVIAWYALQHLNDDMQSLSQRVQFGFAVLFPLAFAIGVTYPLAVRILARGVDEAASASARVYSWNTVGAIVGAIAGGFVVVPSLRYEGSVQVAVVTSALLAVLACMALFKPGKLFAAGVTLIALVVIAAFRPTVPEPLLRYSPLRVSGKGELLYYDLGRSAAVVTLRLGDQINVRTNGLPEAAIDLRGTSPQLYAEAWMAPLAVLARPQLQDMLIVGFGGGRVVEAVPPSVQHVDVIELEDKVIDANRMLTKRGLRDPAHDPLRDKRVRIISNDARGALQLTDKKYDAIVSQPSHPWTAGASHLYTREFMQQARQHLNVGGVFVQWMNVDFLDESLLRSLVATLNSVYPHVRVYRPSPPTLLFLASDAPVEPDLSLDVTRKALAAAPSHYGRFGLNVREDLAVSLALDDAGSRAFAAGASVITDDANRFAVTSLFDAGRNMGTDTLGSLLAPYDPLLHADSEFFKQSGDHRDFDQLAFDYVARRMFASLPFDTGARLRLEKLGNLFPASDLQRYIQYLLLGGTLQNVTAQQWLVSELKQHPDSVLLRNALLEGVVSALVFGRDSDEEKQFAARTFGADQPVMRAAQLAIRGDWSGLSVMESSLANVSWTSIWNVQAMRLRIEERVRRQQSANDRSANMDTIGMIDRLGVMQPNPQLYLNRALSAGGDPYLLMESLFRYTLAILQGTVTPTEVNRRDFAIAQRQFMQIPQNDAINRYHYQEVQSALTAASQLLK